jgi:peptidoglycan/LPS O-acetylase OafA/YrhL
VALAGPALWFAACFFFHPKQPLAAGPATSGFALVAGFALIAIGCAAILQGFCMMGPSRMPRWAAQLGKISFGLYVYHVLAIEFAQVALSSLHGPLQIVVQLALALFLTIVAAILSYTFLESPFLRLKRRFEVVHTRPI